MSAKTSNEQLSDARPTSSVEPGKDESTNDGFPKSVQELKTAEFYQTEGQRLRHIGYWVSSTTKGFEYWSPDLFEMHGLSPGPLPPNGDEYLALIHPDDREYIASLVRQTVSVEVPDLGFTKRIVRPDGEVRYIRCIGNPIVDNGEIKRIGVGIDVTDYEIAVRQIQRREAYLTEAQNLSHIGSFGWKPKTGEIVWSDELYRIFEYPLSMTITLDKIVERTHPEDREFVRDVVERAASSNSALDVEHRLLLPDGRVKYVRVQSTPLVELQGGLPEYLGATADITDQRRAEETLRKSESELRTLVEVLKKAEGALQDREHELLGIIETMPSMLWSAAPDGEPTHINRTVREYSGMSLKEFFERGWKSFIHPDDWDETSKSFFHAIQTGGSYRTLHRLRRADGQYRWHDAKGEPLRDSQGNIIQWYGLAIDIDERKRAEDDLRDMRIKLTRAARIATVAELSASIAHELNQPLMSVLANAQAAKRWLAADSPNIVETVSSIDRIVRDARAADDVMQHIRALFKQEPFEKIDATVLDIVKGAVRFVHEDPKKRDVAIDWRFDGMLPRVSVDLIQIQQVFINLILNAIDATEGRSPHPHVTIQAAITESNEIVVQVIDNGPGVEDPERIFDAFVTTKKTGMGIGLAISRSIVEAHGGRLWAENGLGGGAIFSVVLPL